MSARLSVLAALGVAGALAGVAQGAAAQTPPPPPAGSAAPLPLPAPPESCAVDVKALWSRARQRGYAFESVPSAGTTCLIDDAVPSLTVSAGASADATCSFTLFAPPASRANGVMRLDVKEQGVTVPKYFQRGERNKGLAFELAAGRGVTRQFRVVAAEVEPVAQACPATSIEEAVR